MAELEGRWRWIGPWLGRLLSSSGIAGVLYPLALALLLLFGYGALHRALRAGRIPRQEVPVTEQEQVSARPRRFYWLLTLPVLLAILVWWFTLPDPTLAYALFWLLPIIMAHKFLMALEGTAWSSPHRSAIQQAVAFLVVNLAILVTFALYWPQAVMLSPGFSPLPTPKVMEQLLTRRLSVWTPVDDPRCWNVQLPCTPYANPQLRGRGNDIRHGFQVISQFPSLLAASDR
jgi:hypothetical protein